MLWTPRNIKNLGALAGATSASTSMYSVVNPVLGSWESVRMNPVSVPRDSALPLRTCRAHECWVLVNRKAERKPGFLSVYPFQTDYTNCDYFIIERKEWFDLNYLLWFFISLNKGTENNSPGTRSCVSVKLCMISWMGWWRHGWGRGGGWREHGRLTQGLQSESSPCSAGKNKGKAPGPLLWMQYCNHTGNWKNRKKSES